MTKPVECACFVLTFVGRIAAALGPDKGHSTSPPHGRPTMSLRSILPLALFVLAAGCASATQLVQRDDERCVARGFKPDTPDFKKCATELETERALKMDQRHREMMERSSAPWAR
jgi:hypothetical protein